MQFHLFGTSSSELTTRLQDFLERPEIEGFRSRAYWDTAKNPNATIGYGFNIQDGRDNLKLVLQELYGLSGQAITQFLNDFNRGIAGVRPLSAALFLQNQAGFNGQLRSVLDRLTLQDLGKGPFTINQVQAREVERKILEGYTIDGVVREGVLTSLQRFLSDNAGVSIPSNSNEFVAIAALYYNNPTLVTGNGDLLRALRSNDRAEAWFEIRYGLNASKQDEEEKRGHSTFLGSLTN